MDVRFPPIRTAYSPQQLPEGRRVGVYQGTSRALSLNQIEFRHFMEGGVGGEQVAYWMPTAQHVENIYALARSVSQSDSPLVVDVGGANGFLGLLIAQKGARVLSVDPDPRFLTEGYQHPNLRMVQGDSSWAVANFAGEADLAILAWPPEEVDIIPDLFALQARAVLLIFEPGRGYKIQTKPEGYDLSYGWAGPSQTDLRRIENEEGFYFGSNRFLGYRRADQPPKELNPQSSTPLPWELDLETNHRGSQRMLISAAQIQRINV